MGLGYGDFFSFGFFFHLWNHPITQTGWRIRCYSPNLTDPNSSQPHFLNEIDAVCVPFKPSFQDLNQPHGRTRQTSDVINDISRQKQYKPVVSALFVLKEWGTRPQLLVCQLSPQTIEALCFKSVFQVEQVYIVIMVHRVSRIGWIVGAQKSKEN